MPPQFSIAPPNPPGSDQVQLRQRIFDAEIVVVIGEQLHRAVEREPALPALALRRHHADRDAAGIRCDALELANREHEQIARHLRRRRERNLFEIAGDRLFAGHGHVADREQIARNDDGQREARLERRLVPAREDPPRIGRLQLAGDHPLDPGPGRVVDREQAGAEFVDLRREGDTQLVAAGRKRPGEGQRCGLRGGVGRDLRVLRAVIDRDLCECRVDRVQRQLRGRLAYLDVDGLDARQSEARDIRRQLDRVMQRDDRLRQLSGRAVERKCLLGMRACGHRQSQADRSGKTTQQRRSDMGCRLVHRAQLTGISGIFGCHCGMT
ncbi:hypothetical protein J2R96_006008 [Bradyrhizobium elkanii]|nr:hypothetical protein [Bradyrhizobium elkanii]